ncbi:MAG: hypothetical protein GXP05_07580 [Alphaproteobacteria bacterium]|nr:hypothetical protein [Alphaproteobacteria bacterium]
MEPILETETCGIEAYESASDWQNTVLLSFTGIGHAMGGLDVQTPEFFGAGRGFDNVIFISDLARSWGNALDFDEIVAALRPFVAGRKIFAIGNSMGGFLGVVMSNLLEIDTVVAFVPQFSVSARVLWSEHRWRNHRVHIKEFKIPSLADQFNAKTQYYLFSSNSWPDRKHWKRFPAQPNIENIVLKDGAHNLAAGLKKSGQLSGLIEACFTGQFSIGWMNDTLGVGARKI